MRKYKIEYARGIVKDLKNLPQEVVKKILHVAEKDLAIDPHKGRPLAGQYKGLWKYRVGDYRIIYSIEEDRVVIFVLRVRHRKDVYHGII